MLIEVSGSVHCALAVSVACSLLVLTQVTDTWLCMQTRDFVLTACNPTDIPAGLKTLVEGRDSPFKVDPREATLQPHETLPITVGFHTKYVVTCSHAAADPKSVQGYCSLT